MTENRRIALNIAATNGRSLFALVCGLFTSRWVLMALGQSDYGLYGVSGDGPKAARCPLYTATIQLRNTADGGHPGLSGAGGLVEAQC